MLNIYRMQDSQIADDELKIQYYKAFLNGDVATAQNIYNDNPQLQGKVIEKDIFNQLLNGILTLEENYDTGVTQYLTNQLSKFQININELITMQTFSPITQYEINNFVLYNDLFYFCYEKPPVGTLPTNTTYWLELGLKGDKGAYSLGVNYKGNWSNVIPYKTKDMVVYNNDLYVVISGNTNKNPSTNPDLWFKAVDIIPKIIYISITEPNGLTSGDIWMKIL